ncbi:MAG: ATP12 family protein [Alphaproteobacteria bacterium]|nr:ATP12 family protein [Alphaproteobacteria bacterium]
MKRFYKDVTIKTSDSGYQICLDGRPSRSPAKAVVVVPTQALAEAVQAEWQAVGDEIQPEDMPLYSMAVTVTDRVTPQRQALADELAGYIHDDVLRYRSGEDRDLASRQTEIWDPWLNWAEQACGLRLPTTAGLMPVSADDATEHIVRNRLQPLADAQFGCLYRVATLSGSVVLGLAFQGRHLGADEVFETAFLDELYQNSLWGKDEEAAERQVAIRCELKNVERFMNML